MPYKGDEKLKCPRCNTEMSFIETDGVKKLGGFYCKACCQAGLGPWKIGNVIVGRP